MASAGLLALVLAAAIVPATPALDEEFTGRQLDTSIWRTCHWWAPRNCTIATNEEYEAYTPEQVRVGEGMARLVAERRRTRTSDGVWQPFRSGMISSGPGRHGSARFAFRYGRVYARVHLPRGFGLWPALWMLPADRESEPEVDIFEVSSDAPRVAQLHVHPAQGSSQGHRVDGIGPGWHTFGLVWRADRLVWFVDGRRRWTVRGDAVPQEPMYLVVNLAVDDEGADTPGALAVDWIRVWR